MKSLSNLLVYLPFKDITKREDQLVVVDGTGNGHDGLIVGSPAVVPDDEFGSCLYFEAAEDRFGISGPLAIGDAFYFEIWAKPKTDKDQVIVSIDFAEGDVFSLGYQGEKIWVATQGKNVTFEQKIESNVWVHLGISVEKPEGAANSVASLYYNGLVISKADLTTPFDEKIEEHIAKEFFQGNLGHLKIYGNVLSPKEVVRSKNGPYVAEKSNQGTHPIEFDLDDDNSMNSLFIGNIGDISSEQVQLRITNNTDNSIMLTPQQKSDPGQFHFELRFRPNTFEGPSLISVIKKAENWLVSAATVNPINKCLSLFFSYSGSEELEFKAGESFEFELEYSSADGKKGPRNTQLLLLFKQMSYQGSAPQVSGKRLKQAEITSRRGVKDIPIHSGFVGANTILNDSDPSALSSGTKCKITLRLKNILKTGTIRFLTGKEETGAKLMTKFTLTFDAAQEEQALASVNELAGITVTPKGNWANVVKTTLSSVPIFTIDDFQITELAAGEVLDIEVGEIRSSKLSGFANIYLRYENIVGYWNGEIVFVVEKTPIVSRNIGNEKKIGIGTMPEEAYQLKVGGNVRIEPDADDELALSIGSKDKEKSSLSFTKAGSLGIGVESPKEKLEVQGRIRDETGFLMPPGVILPFAGPEDSVPDGFLLCNGQEVDRTEYQALYNAIGDSWGANGSQFRVPDLPAGSFIPENPQSKPKPFQGRLSRLFKSLTSGSSQSTPGNGKLLSIIKY